LDKLQFSALSVKQESLVSVFNYESVHHAEPVMISLPPTILVVVVSVFNYYQPYWCRSAWSDRQLKLDWHLEGAVIDIE
jgi:hypothetical protein